MDRVSQSDQQLLESYGRTRCEEAFAEIVRRHCGLVYSAAFRQLRSTHLAEEATQCVFAELAQKVRHLKSSIVVPAWLYRVTSRTAVDIIRRESRRKNRELLAFTMNTLSSSEDQWDAVMPLLDDAMASLKERDRTAVLLRFFDKKSLREIGSTLAISEAAAQKRITRALDHLRNYFANRGVATTASGISALMLAHAVEGLPTGLPTTILTAALSTTSLPASGGSLLTIMNAAKLKIALVAAGCAALTTSLWWEVGPGNRVQNTLTELRRLFHELNGVRAENNELAELASLARRPKTDLKEELERLRSEVAALNLETNRSVQLDQERKQITAAIRDARQDSGPSVQYALQNDETLAASSSARDWVMAARRYASEHNGRLPSDLTLASQYLPQSGSNSSTTDFEIVSPVSEETLSKYAKAGQLLLVRQKHAWKNSDGTWVKAYGFMDGSAAVFGVENNRFQEWEAHHSLPVQIP